MFRWIIRHDDQAEGWRIFGRFMFRCYRTRGVGFRFRHWNRRLFVEMWLGRYMVELFRTHKEDCECDECLPF